jgi:hypothetical protein
MSNAVDTVETAAKTAGKATKAAAKATVTPIPPIDISTTKNAINLKLGKQQLALIAGTAVTTVATLKVIDYVRTRRLVQQINERNAAE